MTIFIIVFLSADSRQNGLYRALSHGLISAITLLCFIKFDLVGLVSFKWCGVAPFEFSALSSKIGR